MRISLSPTRLSLLLAACLALGACTSSGDSGFSQQFSADAFSRSNDTNGTQTRRDVNRSYTQPSLPTIGNRGY
ncbi:hypothetical protein [Methylobacterium hispanicum]|jgi:hypothetical protein|uniref:Lipoprotein n=2 Tax=Methylobacterium TaxID=407 RepID=A0AAV4ZUY9_9HYPH|nr:hypothetical protein [Methylobacterium hispanicum]GJD91933.1 hypothetical protein BHAOGJBA_5486 [Methylobacterium hispanicum]